MNSEILRLLVPCVLIENGLSPHSVILAQNLVKRAVERLLAR